MRWALIRVQLEYRLVYKIGTNYFVRNVHVPAWAASPFSPSSPYLLQSSGDEMEEFEVELYKKTRGLGITIAGLVKEDTGGGSVSE